MDKIYDWAHFMFHSDWRYEDKRWGEVAALGAAQLFWRVLRFLPFLGLLYLAPFVWCLHLLTLPLLLPRNHFCRTLVLATELIALPLMFAGCGVLTTIVGYPWEWQPSSLQASILGTLVVLFGTISVFAPILITALSFIRGRGGQLPLQPHLDGTDDEYDRQTFERLSFETLELA